MSLLMGLTMLTVGVMPASAEYDPAVSTGGSGGKALVPVGHTVGIKLFADGVVIIETTTVETDAGTAAPAKDAGLRSGDVLVSIDGHRLLSAEDLVEAVKNSETGELNILFRRGDRERSTIANAVKGADGCYHLGAMVRDSIAGIGTMTYYDPDTGRYGALGHGINDMDTGILMPVESGAIMGSTVASVKKGAPGAPGELHGSFDMSGDTGSLEINCVSGIFGDLYDTAGLPGEALLVASGDEIETGDAYIYSNVSGDEVGKYAIKIVKKSINSADGRDMLIEVTDPALLEITGGIVQGMSGSPIIQNGKIIGAVTHVLVDRPTIGYGIYIENMLESDKAVASRAA